MPDLDLLGLDQRVPAVGGDAVPEPSSSSGAQDLGWALAAAILVALGGAALALRLRGRSEAART
ncbi:MAG: hypothetical protein ABR529_15500 [Actinomycetota bacterium]